MSSNSMPRSSSIRELPKDATITTGADGVDEVIRYVEVPIVEEVVREIPRMETIEVEKFVPKITTEYVDKIVEIPEIQIVEKVVEVPYIEEIVKHVTRKEVVPVHKEIVKHVTRHETKIVEKEVKVPGKRIEVPKPFDVVNEVVIPRYLDMEVPTIVKQDVIPIVSSDDREIEVDAVQYEPVLVPVDIYIPKPTNHPLKSCGKITEDLRDVNLPAPQYNLLVREMNPHLLKNDKHQSQMPYIAEADGSIHFVGKDDAGARFVAEVLGQQLTTLASIYAASFDANKTMAA